MVRASQRVDHKEHSTFSAEFISLMTSFPETRSDFGSSRVDKSAILLESYDESWVKPRRRFNHNLWRMRRKTDRQEELRHDKQLLGGGSARRRWIDASHARRRRQLRWMLTKLRVDPSATASRIQLDMWLHNMAQNDQIRSRVRRQLSPSQR